MGIFKKVKKSIRSRYFNYKNYRAEREFYRSHFENAQLEKELILFYFTPFVEFPSGGLLSILFLIEQSIDLKKNSTVLPITLETVSYYKRIGFVQNPFFISNLLFMKKRLDFAEKIVIHVPEVLYHEFCSNFKRFKIGNGHKIILNILNQNNNYLPKPGVVVKYKGLFRALTMTLAFEANKDHFFEYLDMPPVLLNSWFYGDTIENIPFNDKKDIAIISDDYSPYKDDILNILKSLDIKPVIIKDMPFEKFKELQKVAKWSFSFGEGYDGYSAFAFYKDGIGFGVYDEDFFPPNMKPLPKTFYLSYNDMVKRLRDDILDMNTCSVFEHYVAEVKPLIIENNSPKKVRANLEHYYRLIDQKFHYNNTK